MSVPAPLPPYIVFYDGVCGLCAWAVRFLIDHDPNQRLMFAPIQGETAAALGIEWDEAAPPSEASVLFVDTTPPTPEVRARSRAVLACLETSGAWPVVHPIVRFVPTPLLDVAYKFVARIRYRVFGRHDVCQIPDRAERARFLA